MEYDSKKVLTGVSENIMQWLGWKGFYANDLAELIEAVDFERKNIRYGRLVIVDCTCANMDKPFGINWEDSQCPDGDCDVMAEYFYPVEPPEIKSERRYRPYKDIREMVVCETFFDEDDLSEPWRIAGIATATTLLTLRKKDDCPYLFGRIMAVDLRTDEVTIARYGLETVDLRRLFEEWEWANGKPCGAEIEEGNES